MVYRKDLRRVGLAHGQDSIERISRVRMGERICMAGDLSMGRGFSVADAWSGLALRRIDGKVCAEADAW